MNPAGYYYADTNNQPQGPFTAQQLLAMLHARQLSPATLVAVAGTQQWFPLQALVPAHSAPQPSLRQPYGVAHGTLHGAHGHHGPGRSPAVMQPQRRAAYVPPHRRSGLTRIGYLITVSAVGLVADAVVQWVLQVLNETPASKILEGGVTETTYTGSGGYWAVLILTIVCSVAAILALTVSRLSNIGWNPWLCVLALVPVAHLFIDTACCALPAGYAADGRIDGPGKAFIAVRCLLGHFRSVSGEALPLDLTVPSAAAGWNRPRQGISAPAERPGIFPNKGIAVCRAICWNPPPTIGHFLRFVRAKTRTQRRISSDGARADAGIGVLCVHAAHRAHERAAHH